MFLPISPKKRRLLEELELRNHTLAFRGVPFQDSKQLYRSAPTPAMYNLPFGICTRSHPDSFSFPNEGRHGTKLLPFLDNEVLRHYPLGNIPTNRVGARL